MKEPYSAGWFFGIGTVILYHINYLQNSTMHKYFWFFLLYIIAFFTHASKTSYSININAYNQIELIVLNGHINNNQS